MYYNFTNIIHYAKKYWVPQKSLVVGKGTGRGTDIGKDKGRSTEVGDGRGKGTKDSYSIVKCWMHKEVQ